MEALYLKLTSVVEGTDLVVNIGNATKIERPSGVHDTYIHFGASQFVTVKETPAMITQKIAACGGKIG